MPPILIYIAIGLFAGISSGLVGIGGGIIITPALVLLCKFTQQQAQGTTLALLVPPVGLLAAYQYFKHGLVDVRVACYVCIGFFVGGLLGAKIATALPNNVLEKLFGALLMGIGIKMLFFASK